MTKELLPNPLQNSQTNQVMPIFNVKAYTHRKMKRTIKMHLVETTFIRSTDPKVLSHCNSN